ncbi:PTS ascorbate transporter subunit IIC [Suttonella ornithocola]|uniref:Ascorbate-specific PTS system EIIC component n=1 Tax=Suttonella ornithocola TaxID=279832 RepID=A0A380MNW3_9GAMM|nr:PTS ascorbate transporter subunit IIC [Suttonella ornithocola]SUO93583.1 Ascorbate-specific PTS system EIIC component [Suttonella ornithocola]
MEMLLVPWEFFVNNFLKQPAFFIGLIVFIGYLLLRKPWYECLSGFVKASVGYFILIAGAGGLVSSFRPVLLGLKDQFNMSVTVIDPYFGQEAVTRAMEGMGRSFSQVMVLLLIAFIFNIVLVRFQKYTKLRAVFTTGHVQMQQSATAFWLLLFCFPELGDGTLLVMMALALGLYWSVGSNLTVAPAQRLTDGAGFAVGHQQMFAIAIFSKLSQIIFGRKKSETETESKRIEDIKLPGFMSIFNENMVATTILMTLFFGIIMTILGKDYLIENKFMKPEETFFFFIMTMAMKFATYLAILQLGVRTFVAELTESFHGISSKWLPGAVPGIDCAATYGFGSQNAITLGFMLGACGQFLGIGLLLAMGSPTVIVAAFIPMFFDNATIALFSNRHGGYKAALIMPFIAGLCQVLGSAYIAHLTGLDKFGGYLGMWDWAVIWPGFTTLMHYTAFIGFGIVIFILILIPQLQYRSNPEGYFLIVDDYEEYKRRFPKDAA